MSKMELDRKDPGKTKQRWLSWHPFYTPLGVFAGVAIVALSLVFQNPILSPILASVGITIAVTLISSQIAITSGREAFKEQNAKEARIKAKDEVYLPLHKELIAMILTCEASERRETPFPQRVLLHEEDDRVGFAYEGQFVKRPIFNLWEKYKRDGRHFNFSVHTQLALDEVEKASRSYNSSFESYTRKALDTLIKSLTSARQEILKSDQFQIW